MARVSGGANNMRPLSLGGGAQTEKIQILLTILGVLYPLDVPQLRTTAQFWKRELGCAK